jgi:hypothetical protein
VTTSTVRRGYAASSRVPGLPDPAGQRGQRLPARRRHLAGAEERGELGRELLLRLGEAQALEAAEVELAEAGFRPHLEAQRAGRRLGRGRGAPQRRGEDRVDRAEPPLRAQPLGGAPRLLLAELGQRRVADPGEALLQGQRGDPVAQQEQPGGPAEVR